MKYLLIMLISAVIRLLLKMCQCMCISHVFINKIMFLIVWQLYIAYTNMQIDASAHDLLDTYAMLSDYK